MRRIALVVVLLSLSCSVPKLNGSTDGRVHTCGYVTEDGVTEHLHDFWARCGRS